MASTGRLRSAVVAVLVNSFLCVLFVACDRPNKTSEATVIPPTPVATSRALTGKIGASSQWGSGWIVLDVIQDFKRGDNLRLRVGGTAHKIVLRLLPKGASPDDATGVDGGIIDVPPDRVVVVSLEHDHPSVEQISVHGGPNPWNLYSLGEDNGGVTLQDIQRVSP